MNAPIPKHYDPRNAAVLVQFAAESYMAGPADVSDVIENATTDTRAVIYQPTEQDMIVAFRGTRSLQNFVTDVRCQRVPLFPGSNAEVHEGFQQALDSIWASLNDTIVGRLAGRRDLRLWFTGHSLGAALAKLAALRFNSAFTNVYTFGEPRVGNAAFRDLYNSQLGNRTFRVVDGEDFITRIPWLLGAYRHSGMEVFYGGRAPIQSGLAAAAGTECQPYLVNPHWWTKGLCDVCGTWEEWERDGRVALLADHHVGRYQELFSTLNPNLNLNLPLPSAGKAEIKIKIMSKIAPSPQ